MQEELGTSKPKKYANKVRTVLINIGPKIKQPLTNNPT